MRHARTVPRDGSGEMAGTPRGNVNERGARDAERTRGARKKWTPRGTRQFEVKEWSGKRDSNPRPSAWKADALPLSYSRSRGRRKMVVGEGFEPSKPYGDRFTVCSL